MKTYIRYNSSLLVNCLLLIIYGLLIYFFIFLLLPSTFNKYNLFTKFPDTAKCGFRFDVAKIWTIRMLTDTTFFLFFYSYNNRKYNKERFKFVIKTAIACLFTIIILFGIGIFFLSAVYPYIAYSFFLIILFYSVIIPIFFGIAYHFSPTTQENRLYHYVAIANICPIIVSICALIIELVGDYTLSNTILIYFMGPSLWLIFYYEIINMFFVVVAIKQFSSRITTAGSPPPVSSRLTS